MTIVKRFDVLVEQLRGCARGDPRPVSIEAIEAQALLHALGLKIDPEVPQWRVVWHMDRNGDEEEGGADFVSAIDASDARETFKQRFPNGNSGPRDNRTVVITSVTKED